MGLSSVAEAVLDRTYLSYMASHLDAQQLQLLFLGLSEAVLASTHLQVLLCIGRPLSRTCLGSKRWSYFPWDLVSVQLALAALACHPAISKHSLTSWLVPLAVAHSLQHLFYIATWATPHTSRVLDMSCCSSFWSRFQQQPYLQVLWYVLGTAYDIGTHAVMLVHILMAYKAGNTITAK